MGLLLLAAADEEDVDVFDVFLRFSMTEVEHRRVAVRALAVAVQKTGRLPIRGHYSGGAGGQGGQPAKKSGCRIGRGWNAAAETARKSTENGSRVGWRKRRSVSARSASVATGVVVEDDRRKSTTLP